MNMEEHVQSKIKSNGSQKSREARLSQEEREAPIPNKILKKIQEKNPELLL